MTEGRGSVRPSLVLGVVVLCLLALASPTLGAIFNVGGGSGWTFNVNNWPRGKSFRAGDMLVFNYAKILHNVVPVSKSGFDSCRSPRGAKVFQTGKERIRLSRGLNYFICTIPGHCKAGMKIAINAA